MSQVALGWYSHHRFDKNRTKRPLWNVAHILWGIALIVRLAIRTSLTWQIAGYVQVLLGLKLYDRAPPTAVYVVFAIVVVAFLLSYLASAALLARSWRREGHSWNMAIAGLGRSSTAAGRIPVRGKGDPGYDRWMAASAEPTKGPGQPYAPLLAESESGPPIASARQL